MRARRRYVVGTARRRSRTRSRSVRRTRPATRIRRRRRGRSRSTRRRRRRRSIPGPAPFVFSSSEPNSTFECKLDTAAFAACTSPYVARAPWPTATHTFSVRATDAAGNVDPTPATRTFTVDTTAPETRRSRRRRAPYHVHVERVGLDVRVPHRRTAVRVVHVAVHGRRPWPTATHTFAVRATDAAGNTDPTPATRTFTVDTTAPETTITSTRARTRSRRARPVRRSSASSTRLSSPRARRRYSLGTLRRR